MSGSNIQTNNDIMVNNFEENLEQLEKEAKSAPKRIGKRNESEEESFNDNSMVNSGNDTSLVMRNMEEPSPVDN